MARPDTAAFAFDGNRTGIVLTHGFSGSPPEMRPLGEYLAARGYTVRGLRLPGHGTLPHDLLRVDWQDWVAAVDAAVTDLNRVCNAIFLCGLSMGATLSLYTASQRRVTGVISMAAPIIRATDDWRVRALPVLKYVRRWYEPTEQPLPAGLTPVPPDAIWSYRRTPTRAIHELDKLVGITARRLPTITAPTLIIASELDPVVAPKNALYLYDHLGAQDKELLWFNKSGHGLPVDVEREEVWAAIDDWIVTRTPRRQPHRTTSTHARDIMDKDVADVLRLSLTGIDQPEGLDATDGVLLKSEAADDAEAVGAAEFSAEQTTDRG